MTEGVSNHTWVQYTPAISKSLHSSISAGGVDLPGSTMLLCSPQEEVRRGTWTQVTNTGPAGRIGPFTLFYPPSALFLPSGSTELSHNC